MLNDLMFEELETVFADMELLRPVCPSTMIKAIYDHRESCLNFDPAFLAIVGPECIAF